MQRRYIIILVALTMFLATSCGTKRKAQKRADELKYGTEITTEQRQEKKEERKILYPVDHDPSQQQYEVKDGHTEIVKEAGRETEQIFSVRESANIRVAGVNPLPAGGVLELDLDQMSDEFCYPYRGEVISEYGYRGRAMHTGVDIRTIPNDTIRAILSGVVRMSKMYSSYGNVVVIQHDYGFETVYAHCSRNLVNVNDVVKAGDPIGLGGRTGRATTEHLHFEVRVAGEHVDPTRLLDVDNHRLHHGMLYIGLVDGQILAYNSLAEARQLVEKSNQAEVAQKQSEQRAAEVRVEQNVAADKAAEAQQQFYKVTSGDTLYGIALRHKTTVKKLCEMNNIRETDILQINQRLRVK